MTMLPYDICVALRNAGFPQEIKDGSFYFAGRQLETPYCWGGEGEDKPYGEYWLCPTLEELISECGDEPIKLERPVLGLWVVESQDWKAQGSTPSEAVANLYLAITK